MAKKKKQADKISTFEALLGLSERLAQYLRIWFHLTKAEWDFMLDKIRQEKPYKEWSKSKGRGRGRRYFAAPCEELKAVQKKMLNQFLSQIPVHFSRHGGVKGSSIFTNAEHHAGFAVTVFAVDIVDAFPSVFRSRVRACLNKPFEFGLRQFGKIEFSKKDKEQMLEAVVDILVWKDRLPQGPPTSPRVFEIVCGKMDRELFELVQKNSSAIQNYRLSVYADNITISSDGEIEEAFRKEVTRIISDNGFYFHSRKDKMAYFSPQTGTVPVITGLVMLPDGRVLMHPRKVNQLRGRLTQLLRKQLWDGSDEGNVSGILGYVRQVYPKGKNLPSKIRKVAEAAELRLKKSPVNATPAVVVPLGQGESTSKSALTVKKKTGKYKSRGKTPPAHDVLLSAAVG